MGNSLVPKRTIYYVSGSQSIFIFLTILQFILGHLVQVKNPLTDMNRQLVNQNSWITESF